MNGLDLAFGLLAAAVIGTLIRWCAAREVLSHRRPDGLAEMGRAIEAARAANDRLDGRASRQPSTAVRRAQARETPQLARHATKR